MKKSRRHPTAVGLFCGCGGLDLGFKEAGFDIRYAADNDQAAIDVYRANVDDRAYVRDVMGEDFRSDVRALGRSDVVLGGFPCQGFSKAGPKVAGDSRNNLYREMKWAVEMLEPQIFVAENVDGLSQNFSGSYVQTICDDFGDLGYTVQVRILDAVGFGVPQHRRRIFFVGVKKGAEITFRWPQETHLFAERNGEFKVRHEPDLWETRKAVEMAPAVTMRDAIGDLISLSGDVPDHRVTADWPKNYGHIFAAIKPGQKLCNVRHAASSVYTWQIPTVFGPVSDRQITILETIAMNRRHKRFGDIPNGNPIPVVEIERLAELNEIAADVDYLLKSGYLKTMNGGVDLKGAMFCSGLFKRPVFDAASPTILTNFHNPRYFLHPSEDRPFSLRECARLQGFRDSFAFASEANRANLLNGYRLVGNAVPPPLARAIAYEVRFALSSVVREVA